MSLQDHHRIDVFDGGHDGLLPARYQARPCLEWLQERPLVWGHGATAEEAVESVRRQLRERYPTCPWFATVPERRHFHP